MPPVHSVPVVPSPAPTSPSSSGEIPRWVWLAVGGAVILGGVALYTFYGGDENKPKKKTKKSNKPAGNSTGVTIQDLPEGDEEVLQFQ